MGPALQINWLCKFIMLQVQINDEVIIDGSSCQLKKKTAKKDAAWKVLSKLKVSDIL